jgi:hypothetical protein
VQLVAQRLTELLGVDPPEVRHLADKDGRSPDAVVRAGPFTFLVEWKGSGRAAAVGQAIERLLGYATPNQGIPLVAVPFMGEIGRKRCSEAEVAWLDLSGNARIFATGLRILIEGKPNRYKQRGRPSTAFAPNSSRIARWLLMHPSQWLTQREIARATDTDEGYTSRVVGRLEEDELISRNPDGAIRPRNPDLLLDAWIEEYDFTQHRILKGHVAARSGDALLRQIAGDLGKASVDFAATGLGAAWLLDRFAGFRIATLYLAAEPSQELLTSLSFRADERGANVWLVVPNDEGVFHGVTEVGDIRCVHPVQTYLDLSAHPERAEEAAQRLRANHLKWKTNG